MKTIKIFLASSEELEDDRNAFGNLVRKLNKTYEKRGIHLELFEWEDYDAAYNDRRKQDEYNDEVRASDMFLAVFHTKAGKFTIEEFDVATEEFREKGSPKSYVYCKDLRDGEIESEELKEFKRRLFDEMGHYWSRYANRDTMQLHFVMQLQMVENSRGEDLKVKDGNVVLHDQPIARMENLPFAGLNEDFQKMSARLAELPGKIEKARSKSEKYPDDEDFKDDLQTLLNEYNKLRDDFAEYQNNLFATAKRMAKLQGERISERMRRAMDAFNEGKVHEANIILDEAERDADKILEGVKELKAVGRQSVDELKIKASCMIADTAYSIEERINNAEGLYEKAMSLVKECCCEYDDGKELMLHFFQFLVKYAKYERAKDIGLMYLGICENIYGLEHPITAESYCDIALLYSRLDDFRMSLLYYHKAISIFEKEYGEEQLRTAYAYNGVGGVYRRLNDDQNAFLYLWKSLNIRKKILGSQHISLASSYCGIGAYYHNCRDFEQAQKSFFAAIEILEKSPVKDDIEIAIATLYNNIGVNFLRLNDFEKSKHYHILGLEIRTKVFGYYHPDTASSYLNLGMIYDNRDFKNALEYYFKALEIFKKTLGKHVNTAKSFNNIGLVYYRLGDYDSALEYYFKSLEVKEEILGTSHPSTILTYRNISSVFAKLGDDENAELYLKQANLINAHIQRTDV